MSHPNPWQQPPPPIVISSFLTPRKVPIYSHKTHESFINMNRSKQERFLGLLFSSLKLKCCTTNWVENTHGYVSSPSINKRPKKQKPRASYSAVGVLLLLQPYDVIARSSQAGLEGIQFGGVVVVGLIRNRKQLTSSNKSIAKYSTRRKNLILDKLLQT